MRPAHLDIAAHGLKLSYPREKTLNREFFTSSLCVLKTNVFAHSRELNQIVSAILFFQHPPSSFLVFSFFCSHRNCTHVRLLTYRFSHPLVRAPQYRAVPRRAAQCAAQTDALSARGQRYAWLIRLHCKCLNTVLLSVPLHFEHPLLSSSGKFRSLESSRSLHPEYYIHL